jgi:hypothetical protein
MSQTVSYPELDTVGEFASGPAGPEFLASTDH